MARALARDEFRGQHTYVRCYAALSWVALLLGGFAGSLTFGIIVPLLLRLNHSPWGLALYVCSGTLAALAFFPFFSLLSLVLKGPDTTKLHRSVYLGFMVWQSATAATLALFQAEPKAQATWAKENPEEF